VYISHVYFDLVLYHSYGNLKKLAGTVATMKISIEIDESLLKQAEILAAHLNISQNHLFQIALEQFIDKNRNVPPIDVHDQSGSSGPNPTHTSTSQLVVNQGDIYWVRLEELNRLESDIPHPYVVVQDNIFNHSRIHTVLVCALTSNIKRANTPGNVLLDAGEANLPKQSVVEISKISTVAKAQLGEYIGSVDEPRMKQILAGMRFLHQTFFAT
jgi:mRNA interferase MazF